MLAGLVLLALNLESTVERSIVALLLWWETSAVLQVGASVNRLLVRTGMTRMLVQLARGNLIAHRERNRKTTIMYSVSLAFIVFIAVAANQQLQTQLYTAKQAAGTPLAVCWRRLVAFPPDTQCGCA